MTFKRIRDIVLNVVVRMQKPYYQGVAAELAFFFLLSVVPLFILMGQFLGLFSLSVNLIDELLSQYISTDILDNLKGYIKHTPSGTINIVFILITLWSASKAQYSMIRIANYTYTGLHSGKGFFRERLRAMVSVILTILLIVFSLVILVYGEPLMDLVSYYVEIILGMQFNMNSIWYMLRWPLGIAIYFMVISFIHYILPTTKLPYKKLLPGSTLTSAGMLLATWVYSYYTSNYSNYDVLYGSLGTVIGLLMWFYILGYVIVIGIVFNTAIQETR